MEGGGVILAHVYIILYISKFICTVTYILTYTVQYIGW